MILSEEYQDFRRFLYLAFMALGIGEPSKIQYEIADIIQNVLKSAGVVPLKPDSKFAQRYPMLLHRDGRIATRIIVEAYRGFGKSLIAALATVWVLGIDQKKLAMAVSAAKVKSDEFTTFCLQALRDITELQELLPNKALKDRCSALAFDVRGHGASQAPSVRSVGIFGMITGGRADFIIPDDIEVPKTSETQALREKLWARSAELGGAVLKPGGVVLVLGTPQCEESIYDRMERERGYRKVVFPARMPSDRWISANRASLAPCVLQQLEELGPQCQSGYGIDGTLGIATDPGRFGEQELVDREAEYGRSGFMLQFLLDTSLSDRDLYPLKLRDLMVMDVPRGEKLPESLTWASSPELAWDDLPNVGFRGDRMFRPWRIDDQWRTPAGCVMFIDPAGRGQDEIAWAVVKSLHGYLYCMECRGLRGGYEESNLVFIAQRAMLFGVQEVVVEPNFGDGMFLKILGPVLQKIYPCTLRESERASTQKEKRIIDTIEPVMTQHKLIIDREVVLRDCDEHEGETSVMAQQRSLLYQLTRITKEAGCLRHDDRLDALAGAIYYWRKAIDTDVAAAKRHNAEEDVKQLIESWNSAFPRRSQQQRKDRWFAR